MSDFEVVQEACSNIWQMFDDSSCFTHHDETLLGSSVFVGSLPLAWRDAHRDIRVGVNGERVTMCLHVGKLTPMNTLLCPDSRKQTEHPCTQHSTARM